MKFPYLSQLVIPKSFDECVTYEKQILWLKSQIDTISGGGNPEIINTLKNGLELVQSEVVKLKSDVSAIDVSAINESIDQIKQEITNIKSSIDQKQDKLTFDTTPTENSLNPVVSGGVKSYVDNSVQEVEQSVNRKVDETTFNQAIQNIANTYETTEDVNTKLSEYVQSSELVDYAKKTDLSQYAKTSQLDDYAKKEELDRYATKMELSGKQDKLTFDPVPLLGSPNPVTSNGIKEALDSIPSVTLDDNVTENGTHAVKSSGVYSFVQAQTSNLATKDEITNLATKDELSGLATKEELQAYDTTSDVDRKLAGYATTQQLETKQDTLTFDETPTLESRNPVTSDGIKKAIDAAIAEPIQIDQSVSADSNNAVSSSGVYNFVVDQVSGLATTEQLANKQDKLTFDATPTEGSNNPVTSDGIKKAINSIPSVTLDDTVTAEGTNAVKSSGVYNFVNDSVSGLATKEELSGYATTQQLETKQDALTFDETPTEGSNNPVTSGGIKSALDSIPSVTLDDTVTADGVNAVKSSGVYNFVTDAVSSLATKEELSGFATTQQLETKQDTLTFDETPTLGSQNPVTSDGIKKAIDSIPSVTLDDTVTAEGTNAVKSSGVYNFVTDAVSGLATKEELATATESTSIVSEGSIKLIESGGVFSYVNSKLSDYALSSELENKQDKLTFDDTPTVGSNNPVTSSGIKAAIDAIQPSTLDDIVTQESGNAVKSSGIYSFVNESVSGLATTEQLSAKQDVLTFDNFPTINSQNPVRSDGIAKALSKSWIKTGVVDIYFVPQGSGADPTVIKADVLLEGGAYGSNPTSIFLIKGAIPATTITTNASFQINNSDGANNENYFVTKLGDLNMYATILSGVLFTGVGNYSLHTDNIEGTTSYFGTDTIQTTSSGFNEASFILCGICFANLG